MPNGFRGSEDEWERLEAPLKSLDGALAAYAASHGLVLSRNHHNWPERSLKWGAATKRLIQIYLHDEKHLTFNVWLCASEDRGSQRYWKRRFLKQAVPIRKIEENLNQLLDAGRVEVEGWESNELEFAGPIGR